MRDTRWSDGPHGSRRGYNKWGVMFSLVQRKNSLTSIDVGMVGQTMLKLRVPLYDCFIFVFLN